MWPDFVGGFPVRQDSNWTEQVFRHILWLMDQIWVKVIVIRSFNLLKTAWKLWTGKSHCWAFLNSDNPSLWGVPRAAIFYNLPTALALCLNVRSHLLVSHCLRCAFFGCSASVTPLHFGTWCQHRWREHLWMYARRGRDPPERRSCVSAWVSGRTDRRPLGFIPTPCIGGSCVEARWALATVKTQKRTRSLSVTGNW